MFFILVLLAGAVVALAIQGIKEGKAKAQLIENEMLRDTTESLLELAETIVGSINQTVVNPLKNSPELKFDKTQQKKVLEGAKSAIKKNLDDNSIERLTKYRRDFDSYLTNVVENEVRKQKYKQ